MSSTFFKAHGLGNDYLVHESGPPLDADAVVAACARHTGVGGDGILEPFPTARAALGIRIWNPDGSVAEKSGNGIRIASWWWRHVRGGAAEHTVDTGFDVVACAVDGDQVRVEMGRATFDGASIPAEVHGPLDAGGDWLVVRAVGVGNPHAVVFVDGPLDALPWRRWGEHLERHPAFPNRTNVQFARVAGPRTLELRIWERGAGPTLASGSSSCAAAAAAVLEGRLPAGDVALHMPGGRLDVHVAADFALTLRGPVAPVGRFTTWA